MAKQFPFSVVPEKLGWVAGEYDEETNSFHQHGHEGEVGYWFETLTKHLGPLLAPGQVNMYVPVSRTAVHSRIKRGDLTTFYFHSKPATEGLFLGKKEPRESPFVFVTSRECEFWAHEIRAKKARLGQISLPEFGDRGPDWYEAFWAADGSAEYGSVVFEEQSRDEEKFMKQIYKGLRKEFADYVKELEEHQKKTGDKTNEK
jgi:hypothetical protein